MAFKNAQSGQDSYQSESLCAACRDGLDRVGRYCAKCLRSRRLKMFFGALVFAQCAAVGVFVSQSKGVNRVVPNDGSHTVAVLAAGAQTGWYYFDITDPLIEDVAHHGRIISDSAVAPKGAPASPGAREGTLEVSFSRHYGKSVILTFPPVPRACLANVCELRALFDNDGPQMLPYQDISGHGKTVFMLSQPADFLKRLPSAHRLTFIATLGMPIDNTLTFDVDGFRMRLAAIAGKFRTAAVEKKGVLF